VLKSSCSFCTSAIVPNNVLPIIWYIEGSQQSRQGIFIICVEIVILLYLIGSLCPCWESSLGGWAEGPGLEVGTSFSHWVGMADYGSMLGVIDYIGPFIWFAIDDKMYSLSKPWEVPWCSLSPSIWAIWQLCQCKLSLLSYFALLFDHVVFNVFHPSCTVIMCIVCLMLWYSSVEVTHRVLAEFY
jgi:hypothetical protein